MKTLTKFCVSKLSLPVDGNRWFNVQVFRSVDGGRTWWYCGTGRHCTDLDACRQYIATQTPRETAVVGVEWPETA
ncbi:MAG: hypothetical protein LUE89_11300 [Clostridiales bacterium]|nr:hypothetical protein [Clostridiales bacterium]